MEDVLLRIERLLQLWLKHAGVDLATPALQPVPIVDEWLRADEVRRILGISEKTLYLYTKKGAFEFRQIGGTKFYSKASVMGSRNGFLR